MLLSEWEVGDIIRETAGDSDEHFLVLSVSPTKIYFYVIEEAEYDFYVPHLFKNQEDMTWTKVA